MNNNTEHEYQKHGKYLHEFCKKEKNTLTIHYENMPIQIN